MKVGLVTKLGKRDKATSKKIRDEVIPGNFDVIVIFLTFGQFGAIRIPDSGRRACKIYVFINNNPSSYKNWKQN